MDLEASDIRLRGWLGQWDGYKAATQAKTAVYEGQVKGFVAGIDAQRALLDGQVAFNTGKYQNNKALSDQYIAEWDSIKVEAESVGRVLEAALRGPAIAADIEKARVQAEATQLQLAVENAKLNQGKGIAEAQLYMEKIKSVTEMGRQAQNILANVGANVMGSYLTAGQINVSVSESSSCASSVSDSNNNISQTVHQYNCDC